MALLIKNLSANAVDTGDVGIKYYWKTHKELVTMLSVRRGTRR